MRCGDCKHWAPVEGSTDEDFELLKDFGHCQSPKIDGEPAQFAHGYRGRLGHVNTGFRVEAGDRLAVPCDGSGYSAALLTRDNFGCILFEQKAAETQVQSEEPKP